MMMMKSVESSRKQKKKQDRKLGLDFHFFHFHIENVDDGDAYVVVVRINA